MSQLHDPRVTTLRSLGNNSTALVLLAFLMWPGQGLGNKALRARTGLSKRTITDALDALGALGIIQQHARYSGWLLTSQARQMLLGEGTLDQIGTDDPLAGASGPYQPALVQPGGAKSIPPGSSSSSCYKGGSLLSPQETTTTTAGGAKSIPPVGTKLPADWRHLADLLVERCATPERLARKAVQAAHDRDEFPGYVRFQILRWLSYCTSDDGRGIDAPSVFIPSRIEQGIPCPKWHRPERGSTLAREIRRADAAWSRQAQREGSKP